MKRVDLKSRRGDVIGFVKQVDQREREDVSYSEFCTRIVLMGKGSAFFGSDTKQRKALCELGRAVGYLDFSKHRIRKLFSVVAVDAKLTDEQIAEAVKNGE